MRTKGTRESYESLCKALDENSKLYFNRFGDGDVFIMMGRNESKHTFSPELQKEMIESFMIKDPIYMKGLAVKYEHEPGMQKGLFAPHGTDEMMYKWLVENYEGFEEETFESAIMFHYISVFNQPLMIEMLDTYIRPKKKMYIGSISKEQMEKLVGDIDYYVEVPSSNAYYSIDQWWPKILENIDNVDLVLPAAGMGTRVINKRLYNLGYEVQSIDLGSVIDAIGQSYTRTWIRMVKPEHIKNLLIK